LVVWDGGLAAERLAAWPAYKAQRPPLPADLAPQLDEMAVWLQAAGVASFCAEGVEADDYIATQTRQAERAGWDVLIASSDKDFMQLVSARIGLVNPSDRHETVWTAAHVRARTGVAPKQIVDWLSLAGDSVDNIPGVPGVGPKTAAALLQRFGSLDDLYANLAAVDSASLRARLAGAETGVRRNRGLIRLRDDLPYAFSAAALAVRPPDESGLCELYARWGFRSLLAATPSAAGRQVNLF
jgi:DNA polymerase-1